MSNTRHSTNTDPAHAPGKHLSAPHLRPLNVSLLVAGHAARIHDADTRAAMLWLTNFSINSERIALCWHRRGLLPPFEAVGRITEVELARRVALKPIEIYHALTGSSEADMPAFTRAVAKLRGEFESALPPLVRTEDSATIEAAFFAASEQHSIAVILGKWRAGKTA